LIIKNIKNIGKKIYRENPSLQPFIDAIRKKEKDIPKFSGWGMTSIHEFPWKDNFQGDIFRKTCKEIIQEFDFTDGKTTTGIYVERLESLQWRHWNISYAVRFALKFANTQEFNFIECGVADGISSFFLLSEVDSKKELLGKCSLNLYDSWDTIRFEDLSQSEKTHLKGRYKELELERTQKNLSKFQTSIVYHKGYIPESLQKNPKAPDSICYLHIDLNSSKATLAALEFFYSRLVKGGVILFDDYAGTGYGDTKEVVDEFFSNKLGILQKIPTGQAIYYNDYNKKI
jgi:O-methyltransferase